MGETDKIEDRIVKEEISNAISALQKLEKAVMIFHLRLLDGDYILKGDTYVL